jgi:hypothetical protein
MCRQHWPAYLRKIISYLRIRRNNASIRCFRPVHHLDSLYGGVACVLRIVCRMIDCRFILKESPLHRFAPGPLHIYVRGLPRFTIHHIHACGAVVSCLLLTCSPDQCKFAKVYRFLIIFWFCFIAIFRCSCVTLLLLTNVVKAFPNALNPIQLRANYCDFFAFELPIPIPYVYTKSPPSFAEYITIGNATKPLNTKLRGDGVKPGTFRLVHQLYANAAATTSFIAACATPVFAFEDLNPSR